LLAEGGTPVEAIEVQQTLYTRHLYGLNHDDSCLNTTYTAHVNLFAFPISNVSIQTQVVDTYKYGGVGTFHLNSTRIKRYEQQALSLFRTGVAPYFTRHRGKQNESHNRFHRTCPFCSYIYGVSHVLDVFHVMYSCPLVQSERVAMWTTLGNACGASEWPPADSASSLTYSLLCPQSIEVACVVGRFLSEYLAALEIYEVARENPTDLVNHQPRWLGGGRKVMCDKLKVTVVSYITQRNSGDLVYPMYTCVCTHVHGSIV